MEIIEQRGCLCVAPSAAHAEFPTQIVERQLAETVTDSQPVVLVTHAVSRLALAFRRHSSLFICVRIDTPVEAPLVRIAIVLIDAFLCKFLEQHVAMLHAGAVTGMWHE